MLAVIEQLAIDFKTFAPELVASPKASMYRIYRDTRFSARQDAAQDQRRGELSVARPAPPSGRGAVFRGRAGMGVDWRRDVCARAAAAGEGPRAHRRHLAGDPDADRARRAFKTLFGELGGRHADPRPARLPGRSSGRRHPPPQAVPRRPRAARRDRDPRRLLPDAPRPRSRRSCRWSGFSTSRSGTRADSRLADGTRDWGLGTRGSR